MQARAQGFAWIEGEGDGVEMSRIELVEYRPILLYFSFLPSSQTDHKYHEETSICWITWFTNHKSQLYMLALWRHIMISQSRDWHSPSLNIFLSIRSFQLLAHGMSCIYENVLVMIIYYRRKYHFHLTFWPYSYFGL